MDRTALTAVVMLAVSALLIASIVAIDPLEGTEAGSDIPVYDSEKGVSEEYNGTLFVSGYHCMQNVLRYVGNGTTDVTFCSLIPMCEGDRIILDTGMQLSNLRTSTDIVEADVAIPGGTTHMVLEIEFYDEEGNYVESSIDVSGPLPAISFPTDSFLTANISVDFTSTVTYNANASGASINILETPEEDEHGRVQVTTHSRARSDYIFTKSGSGISSWNTAEDGSGTCYGLSDLLPEGITVYAQWS